MGCKEAKTKMSFGASGFVLPFPFPYFLRMYWVERGAQRQKRTVLSTETQAQVKAPHDTQKMHLPLAFQSLLGQAVFPSAQMAHSKPQ